MAEDSIGPTLAAVVFRLVFLALCPILTKLQFSTKSIRVDGSLEAFRHPMFMNLTAQMALLCSGSIGILVGPLLCERRREDVSPPEPPCGGTRNKVPACSTLEAVCSDPENGAPPRCDDTRSEVSTSSTLRFARSDMRRIARSEASESLHEAASRWRTAWRIGIVSAISMAGGVTGSVALLFLPASIWQLLQASGILFTALMARACLLQRLDFTRRLGIFICIAGVVLAGISDALRAPTRLKQALWGMALTLVSQALGAAAAVAEEHLLKAAAVPPMPLIAWEGAWGIALTLCVVYPAMRLVPGCSEDLADSAAMLLHSPALLVVQAALLLAMMGSSVSGIAITALLSSVHRKMLNVSVGAIVWTIALIVHYCVDASSRFGEPWSQESVLELVGFALIAAGQAIYSGFPHRAVGSKCGEADVENPADASDEAVIEATRSADIAEKAAR